MHPVFEVKKESEMEELIVRERMAKVHRLCHREGQPVHHVQTPTLSLVHFLSYLFVCVYGCFCAITMLSTVIKFCINFLVLSE